MLNILLKITEDIRTYLLQRVHILCSNCLEKKKLKNRFNNLRKVLSKIIN